VEECECTANLVFICFLLPWGALKNGLNCSAVEKTIEIVTYRAAIFFRKDLQAMKWLDTASMFVAQPFDSFWWPLNKGDRPPTGDTTFAAIPFVVCKVTLAAFCLVSALEPMEVTMTLDVAEACRGKKRVERCEGA